MLKLRDDFGKLARGGEHPAAVAAIGRADDLAVLKANQELISDVACDSELPLQDPACR
jgi:hypothetical protein